MDTPYLYLFIRKDIPFTHQLIQLSHAAWEHGLKAEPPERTTHFCLFECDDETELLEISGDLNANSLEHTTFFEPDRDTGFTAIACGPFLKSDPRRNHFRKYELYGRKFDRRAA